MPPSLRLVLETVTIDEDSYDVQTSSVSRYQKGKGKRTATLIGGGAGGGALIGGLAGGGKGALIGAALGAGAGTAGAAYTGEKEIVLPAESMPSASNSPNPSPSRCSSKSHESTASTKEPPHQAALLLENTIAHTRRCRWGWCGFCRKSRWWERRERCLRIQH